MYSVTISGPGFSVDFDPLTGSHFELLTLIIQHIRSCTLKDMPPDEEKPRPPGSEGGNDATTPF